MGRFIMVAQSQAKEGRDEEYNAWYDSTHFQEILDIPGAISGRRFDLAPLGMGEPGMRYLAIFEFEVDGPAAIMREMGRRSQDGTWQRCDALDAAETRIWFYEQREIAT
jgi:hypothetical protein